MSRLFISLYLDEDVDVLLATLLRSQQWVARTVYDEGRAGLSDKAQLEFAARNGLAVFTHNRGDFEKLAAEWAAAGRTHSGIIIAFRRFSTYEMARRLLALLSVTMAEEMDNQVFYI